MNVKLRKLVKNLLKAMKSPRRAIEFFWLCMFPKDSEAYRIGRWSYGNTPRVSITEVLPLNIGMSIKILRVFDRVIGTSLDTQEILILCAIVKFTNAKNILEIGTYDGKTALNLAANSQADAKIITIDLPPEWNGKFELMVPESYVNVADKAKIGSQFKNTKYSKKIIQIFGDSAKIDWSRLPIPFDVVFIDGCHYYEYVKRDTQNAIRYLKAGGILIWHDYGMIKDVSKVVDETAKLIKVKAIRGTRLALGLIE